MKKCVRVYVEGGSTGKTADSDFRRGWKKFLNELHELAMKNGYHSLEIVRGRGRSNTFRSFTNYKAKYPNDLCVILVDSEMAVPSGTRVWDVVGSRKGDGWKCPSWATEEHLYLMVNFVETWIVSDHKALQEFFSRGFNPKPLPTTNLEDRSKSDIEQALKRATKDTSKGPYRHGQAHEIIEFVSPNNVRTLFHGNRLFDSLSDLIKSKP